MVLRSVGWRIVTLAAASLAAAGALTVPTASQGLPEATGAIAPTPSANLVWGGHVPPPPRAGEAPVYIPSPAHSDPYVTESQSAFRGPQPMPEAFLPPPVAVPEQAAAAPVPPAAVPTTLPGEPQGASFGGPPPPAPLPGGAATRSAPPPAPMVQEASLPPLEAGRVIDDVGPGGLYGSVPDDDVSPWEGLTDITPGALPPPAAPPAAPPPAQVPSYAALETRPEPAPERGWSWNPFRWGRGSLSDKVPPGYRSLPRQEAMCRRALQKLGVQFTDVGAMGNGRSCGIGHPVRVTMAAKGIAMQPAATLSCQTALQTARWLDDDVRSAARWTLWKRPTAVLNASSYRCSRIAGSRTISEHALGNALDIRGFGFSDGSRMEIEPKGLFSLRERKFQKDVRTAGCKYFGTVLGPGYNRAHDDHLHFDVKSRMRPVCK